MVFSIRDWSPFGFCRAYAVLQKEEVPISPQVPVKRVSDSVVKIDCRSQTLWYEIEVKGP